MFKSVLISAFVFGILILEMRYPYEPITIIKPALKLVSIENIIVKKSINAGISPHVPMLIAFGESRMKPSLIHVNANGTKDYGIMQLNERTVRVLNVKNPLDPEENIEAGVNLYANYLRHYRSQATRRAVCAYQRGPGRC